MQLIAQIGQPALNRHSLQVEIRRPLYMDEASRERNEGLALRADLTDVLSQTAAYARAHRRDGIDKIENTPRWRFLKAARAALTHVNAVFIGAGKMGPQCQRRLLKFQPRPPLS